MGRHEGKTFKTRHSIYEVDPRQKRIRRISSQNPSKSWTHDNGEWADYKLISIIDVGSAVSIVFDDKTITTSQVKEVTITITIN